MLVARDGNQGLAMAEREDPALVILDMMMPKRSGFLVLEKLRRTRPVPLRVIMITANEGSRHKAYAEMLGHVLHSQAVRHGPLDGKRQAVARLSADDGRLSVAANCGGISWVGASSPVLAPEITRFLC